MNTTTHVSPSAPVCRQASPAATTWRGGGTFESFDVAEQKHRLQILQHTLGLDQFGRGTKYRNHFVSGEGHHDQAAIMEMVREGLMAEHRVSGSALAGGSFCYYVTAAGEAFIAENSPKPPKLTQSQLRGERREFGECFESFRDFLRWDLDPERSWNRKGAAA